MSPAPQDFIVLQGCRSTLILEPVSNKAPLWRYWGEKLAPGIIPPSSLYGAREVPTYALDQNVSFSIFPTFGVGWYHAPALLAHRNGRDFAQDFTACEIVWQRTDQCVTLILVDDITKIKVEITLDLDVTCDVLTMTTRLTNNGTDILDVQHLAAASLILPPSARTVRYYTGRHNQEFVLREDTLSSATWLRENRRGLTSHDCIPAAVIATATTTAQSGPCYGAQLAWSGNHVQRVDCLDGDGYHWQLGEWLVPGEVRLSPGQALEAPQVIATFSPEGLNGIAQNFHTALRSSMTWPGGAMRPRPVHFNTWEGVYFDLDETSLMTMAEGAAALGIERFVLDDGWFHGRRSDQAGLGDWWVDTAIFPNGLLPLAQHVNALGMEFGLWVEPEMVNPDSDLYRAHPDWVLHLESRPRLTARNQLVLDLSNTAAFDYVVSKLGALLDDLPIAYLKWDHNRYLTTAGSDGHPAYRNQVLGAYRMFDAIRAGWPNVEIEACAGGGGRVDAGIIKRTHRFWTSDCIDAVSRVAIQKGFLQFFPPEVMGSHIGTSPAHTTRRRQAMSFRGGVALSGHFGLELDPRNLTPAESTKVKSWIDAYKTWRATLHMNSVWQGEISDTLTWTAQGNPDDAIVSVFNIAPAPNHFTPDLVLPFVDKTQNYQVAAINCDAFFRGLSSPVFLAIARGTFTMSGAWLATAGVPLPPLGGEAALILHVRAVP